MEIVIRFVIGICLLYFILRWFLGINNLEKRLKDLESQVQSPRVPIPKAPAPKEGPIVVGGPALRFDKVASELRLLTLQNGDPGLRSLGAVINGKRFELADLARNEERKYDLSSAMLPGDDNILALVASGEPGGAATVILSVE
jgi:hypothetical protein